MKLREFRVRNYHSVIDSGSIKLADITAFIGPNESGKSSILRGLASLSMDWEYEDFDLTQLGDVSKNNLDGKLKSEDIPIIEALFVLSEDDKTKLKEILSDTEIQDEFVITKYYDNYYSFKLQSVLPLQEQEFRIPSRWLIETTNNDIKSTIEELNQKSAEHLNHDPNATFQNQFDDLIKQLRSLLRSVMSYDEASKIITTATEFTQQGIDEPFKKDVKESLAEIKSYAKNVYPKNSTELSLFHFLLSNMQRTVYFKTYERLEDEGIIKELQNKPEMHRTFMNLLKLADINLDSFLKIDNEKLKESYLENASGKATTLLREAWDEKLWLQFRYREDRMMVFTKDSAALQTLIPPSSGSEGFQWYLGFYINFTASTDAEYKNAILLLDDPGVFLHPKGHKHLLKLLENYLAKNVTTIYSTHLPFMIPRQKFHRIRLVQKSSKEGHSQITEKFYAVDDKDILYPLRAAIGVTLGDSLFVGEETIIAEGVSERILLFGMLSEFKKRNLRPIGDIEKIEVLAGRGAPAALDYAVMLQIEHLPYVVVLDNDGEGRKARDNSSNYGIETEKIVILPQSSNNEQNDFDIEDLFPVNIYAEAFYNVHGEKARMNKAEVMNKFMQGNEKATNKAIGLLKSAQVTYNLDKRAIANEIFRIISAQETWEDSITDNFGKLFDQINSQIKLYEN